MKFKLSDDNDTKVLQLLISVFIVFQVICMGGLVYCIHLINKKAEHTKTEKPTIETHIAKEVEGKKIVVP